MLSERERRLADLALRNRYLTRSQLSDCCSRKEGTPAPLQQILVERGYLTGGEAAEIDRLAARAPLFAEIVRERGLASEGQISEALRLKQQLSDRNLHRYIGEILVDRRVLSPAQVAEVLAEQARRSPRCPACGARFTAAHDPRHACPACGHADGAGSVFPGLRRGAWTLLEELGRGAHGVVYRAHHESLGRDAALKILPCDGPLLARARRGLTVEHPNLARVLDAWAEDEETCIASELVEGLPLYDHVVGNFRLSLREATGLLKQVAAGLAGAHRGGLVHGNLTPRNVLITEMREVKLTDLGVWRGDPAPARVSVAGDLRALGALWHFMLRGELPPLQEPRRPFPDLPELAAVVFSRLRALDARLRYPDADAVRADLDRLEDAVLHEEVAAERAADAPLAASAHGPAEDPPRRPSRGRRRRL